MTERENFFLAYNHKQPEWTPNFLTTYYIVKTPGLNNQGVPGKGGRDMFGANWLVTQDTGYEATPDPFDHVLEDIADWRDVIQFPNLDDIDWEVLASRDLANYNPKEKVLCLVGMEGNFNRLQSLMGTCEAMIAMVEDPEEVAAFFQAYTEFKMKTIEKFAQYYKPDIYVNPDDICSSDGPLFSRAMYEKLIKPFEIMEAQKAISLGMIVEHHVCGKAESFIPDIIETGATIWQTAQSMNDLVKIKELYGDKLLINGGWNSFGPHNDMDCTEEQVRAEVRRCIDTYGKDGNYSMFAVIMGDPADIRIQNRMRWVDEELRSYTPWK